MRAKNNNQTDIHAAQTLRREISNYLLSGLIPTTYILGGKKK